MASKTISWITTTRDVAIAGAIVASAATLELAMGRQWWGIAGQPGFWSGDVNSAHNSQFMFDPYTFSHITHGILIYGLVWIIARRQSAVNRLLIALAIESAWEVVENTDWVIERYRAATISLHYYGDSVVNSMCDIVACMTGYITAARLPVRTTIAAVFLLEVALAILIRDNLLLNIVMLIHPVPAIRTWQSAM